MITTTPDRDVDLITLDRHERRNALDVAHLQDLRRAIDGALARGARAIVLTGDGSSFCAGADLSGVYSDAFRQELYATLSTITAATIPVIAAVNGPAIGAGTQLAIACDLRVVDSTATFAVPTARNGLAVDPWTVRRLALLAGGGTARSILLGCSALEAAEALTHGLADRSGGLHEALNWAQDIATMAPLTLRYSKLALETLFESTPQAASDDATLTAAFEACWSSADLAEATRARAEKRTPRFEGR
ncbi:MAG: enoyl-CoA hydratase [Marmoricola sp.]|nr:enoyl-CoA hydratase [Marmoricola sp.]